MDEGKFTFVLDGVLWRCRPSMPEELWIDFDLLLRSGRRHNHALRRRTGALCRKIVLAVVINAHDLDRRAAERPELVQELFDDVMPDLLSHYEKVRVG